MKKAHYIKMFGFTVKVGSKLYYWIKHYLQTHVVRTHVVMYDSIYVANLPIKKGVAYLGYVGGKWPTFGSGELTLWAKKNGLNVKLLMGIAIAASLKAHALDIERYDATPVQAPGWVKKMQAGGDKTPVLYCSLADFQTVVDDMTKMGFKYGKDYYVVTAHYNFKKHICGPKCGYGAKQTAHGTQWTDKAEGNNHALVDESYVLRRIFN